MTNVYPIDAFTDKPLQMAESKVPIITSDYISDSDGCTPAGYS